MSRRPNDHDFPTEIREYLYQEFQACESCGVTQDQLAEQQAVKCDQCENPRKCSQCAASYEYLLQIHHIIPVQLAFTLRLDPEIITHPDNALVLCSRCHRKIDNMVNNLEEFPFDEFKDMIALYIQIAEKLLGRQKTPRWLDKFYDWQAQLSSLQSIGRQKELNITRINDYLR